MYFLSRKINSPQYLLFSLICIIKKRDVVQVALRNLFLMQQGEPKVGQGMVIFSS
jgi:hypothetical protein